MEETTLITIPRTEYNALIRAAQIVIGLAELNYTADDAVDNIIRQAEDLTDRL